jgi:hypothetical protein
MTTTDCEEGHSLLPLEPAVMQIDRDLTDRAVGVTWPRRNEATQIRSLDTHCFHLIHVNGKLLLKNGVFWVVTPCGSYENRRFGGTWRLLHQGDKNR